MNKRNIGSNYEEKAAVYLEELGYKILKRNFRCRMGEIDIVAKEGRYLVFLEVKYRSGSKKGTAPEAVDIRKQIIICKVAQYYLWQHHYSTDTPCRFDVLGVTENDIELIRDAFEYR